MPIGRPYGAASLLRINPALKCRAILVPSLAGRLHSQQAYGAFSVGITHTEDTIACILNQPAHDEKRDFQQEFLAFLKKHAIDYDPAHVCG